MKLRQERKEQRRGNERTYFLHSYLHILIFPLCLLYRPSFLVFSLHLCFLHLHIPLSSPPSFVLTSFHPSLPLSPLCLYTPLPPSSARLSQSLLFMKVNLQVYQELLAGGGLRRSNHNKASPSTWNRDSIVSILGYFHHRTLHMMVHSHLPLSTNEHPSCFPFWILPRSIIFLMRGWVVFLFFLFFFLLYIAPSSICFLLVYKEQLASGGLHFLTSTCVVLFFTHCCYKSAHSVRSYIIYVVCPPCCAFVLFYTLLKHCCLSIRKTGTDCSERCQNKRHEMMRTILFLHPGVKNVTEAKFEILYIDIIKYLLS